MDGRGKPLPYTNQEVLMLQMTAMPLGAYQTNCYILWEDGSEQCLVIDPGFEPETVLRAVKALGKTVEAILLTHGHFDHVGAVEAIVAQTGCSLWMSQSDYTQRRTPQNDFFYPIHDCDFTPVNFCEEGALLCAGGLELTVLETPGHTPGSVCYLCQGHLFSGDTLFEGSCGRTDLPGGNYAQIMDSLKRLATLDDCKVYPGHGPATTLADEKKYNPYMR